MSTGSQRGSEYLTASCLRDIVLNKGQLDFYFAHPFGTNVLLIVKKGKKALFDVYYTYAHTVN